MSALFDAWLSFFRSGGFVMPPLCIATLLLWYALGWRLMALQRGTSMPERPDTPPAGRPTGIIDTAWHLGLQIVERPVSSLRPHLDEAFAELEARLHRFDTLIRSIVIVAPLAGLLGTVAGMIETFDSLADMSLFAQSGGIAGGISQALVSTQMGLAVAVPGLVVGRILDRRAEALQDELERVKDMLCATRSALANGRRS